MDEGRARLRPQAAGQRRGRGDRDRDAYLGQAILLEASLSFLGLGVQEPTAAWSLMLHEGATQYAESAPWMAVFPGIAISLAVFAFNLSAMSSVTCSIPVSGCFEPPDRVTVSRRRQVGAARLACRTARLPPHRP